MIIVYAYVVADVIHAGHLLYLQNCKALGDKLVVGVLTDRAVMEKKPKPVLPFSERLQLVRNLKCVDVVVAQDVYSPLPNVIAIRPDILCESRSHKSMPANNYVEGYGGRVVVMPYYPETSSSKIKEKIAHAAKKRKHG